MFWRVHPSTHYSHKRKFKGTTTVFTNICLIKIKILFEVTNLHFLITGILFRTCFLFLGPPPDHPYEEDRPLTEAEIEARRSRSLIHFAAEGERKPSGGLTRVPTPYPKELRALAKHTKNILALKKEKKKEVPSGEREPLMKVLNCFEDRLKLSHLFNTLKFFGLLTLVNLRVF